MGTFFKESIIRTISAVGYVLRKPHPGHYIQEQRLTIALTMTILLLLYVLFGSGIVQWVVALSAEVTN